MASPPQPLRVTIVGAGISGLTLALALHHLNPAHRITILEKSHFTREIGAALYVGPNCTRLLLRLGVDLSRLGSNLCEGVMSVDGPTGEVQKEMDLRGLAKKWEAPWLLAHRRDLHLELQRLVIEGGATLELGVPVARVDAERARVELSDGKVVEGDVVIGADGNHSVARAAVSGEAKLSSWGKCCYRWLVERATLTEDPEIEHLIAAPGSFADILGSDRKIVQYPCRNNTFFNFVAFLPYDGEVGADNDWENQGNKAKLLKGFESFSPPIQKILTYAGKDLRTWTMTDMTALPAYNKQNLALIGDAAHPFLPFLGQGAAAGMEDAISIAVLLSNASSTAEIPVLLKLYDTVRRERVEYIREATRTNGLDVDKGKPPPNFLFEMLDFCYRHNEWENTEEKLRQWRDERKEANGARC